MHNSMDLLNNFGLGSSVPTPAPAILGGPMSIMDDFGLCLGGPPATNGDGKFKLIKLLIP